MKYKVEANLPVFKITIRERYIIHKLILFYVSILNKCLHVKMETTFHNLFKDNRIS